MTIFRRKRWRRATTFPSSNLWTAAALMLAVALTEASPLQAQDEQQQGQPAQQEPQRHLVRPGDTLWDLAKFYLEDAFLWPEIYRINSMIIEDPHWIYPDETLTVPRPGELGAEVPGPVVAITPPAAPPAAAQPPAAQAPEGEPPMVLPPDAQAPDQGPFRPEGEPTPEAFSPEGTTLLPPVTGEAPQVVEGDRTIFVTREVERQTLVYQPSEPVPAQAVSPGDFYRSGMLVELDELGPRGEIVDFNAPSSTTGVGPLTTISKYGRMYVSHPGGQAPHPGARLLLFRVDRRFKPFGFVIRPTGLATVAAVYEDVSIAVVTEVFDRVLVGNQIKFAEPFELRPGRFPEAVEAGPTGELIASLDPQNILSIEDVVFIDVGRGSGIVVGDEFEIYLAERVSSSGLKLPEEHIAEGRVVRVTEGTATVRINEQRHDAISVGLPVRLVRKMPL